MTCPDCVRMAVILRLVRRLRPEPSTRAEDPKAVADFVACGGCGEAAVSSGQKEFCT
jgi:hypothetical protein